MKELDDREEPARLAEVPAPAPAAGHETRDSIRDIWGARTPYLGAWPARVDERTVAAPERWVPSACVLCSNGCALDVGVRDGRIVGVRGRATDRVNRGRLGPKGLHAWEANASGDRLTRPLVRRRGRFEPTSWDDALGVIVERTKGILAGPGSDAIGFYTSGQLLLEEYYTLAVIGKAGLGTPHMDGNTRLCTATAARALMESFGCDGQPGSYGDLDTTEALLLVGHNMASTHTVLWSRVLDRRRGPKPPRLVVIDPRRTETAKEADVHLALRAGTNVAVLNGLLRLVLRSGHVDRSFIEEHTVGFEALREAVAPYTPERVEEISLVPAEGLVAAARLLGEARSLVSTVLQGVYQSPQATAAAVQVNNLHLVRGMIGKPGCTVFQMNGQPTAQNTRETGCDGSLPAFRNWANPEHVAELARIWNVDPRRIPSWAPPTHAMEMFRLAEEGTIQLLWISATNPAASLPELPRVRRLLSSEKLFVVVQDAFLTETARLADVVLPAALWAEKTGTFTNTDRTVHLARKAIEPPGEARSDLEIFLEFARRMDLRDVDGAPLVKWTNAEGAFEAWKECSKGRPCDYSGMSYDKLSRGSGVQWPCNERWPEGRERLYEDARFLTDASATQTYGHDLITGAAATAEEYRASDPRGKAILKAASYHAPHEEPDDEFPLLLTTGRVVYHFHTRTKTGRARALQDAAPDVYIQISAGDAKEHGLADGDFASVESRRGAMRGRVRVGDIEPGQIFIPFHYGDWDDATKRRAANELTATAWDSVSKQPQFKYAAVRIAKVEHLDESPFRLLEHLLADRVKAAVATVAGKLRAFGARRHLKHHLGRLDAGERHLATAFRRAARRHAADPDVRDMGALFARWCAEDRRALQPLRAQYGRSRDRRPVAIRFSLFEGVRAGGYGLLLDLHDLSLLAHDVQLSALALGQAARALRDIALEEVIARLREHTERELAWLRTRIHDSAAQGLSAPH